MHGRVDVAVTRELGHLERLPGVRHDIGGGSYVQPDASTVLTNAAMEVAP